MAASPPNPPDQLAASLATAVAARDARIALTAQVEAGERSLGEVLASTDAAALDLKVVSLLESLPGVGKVEARRAMADIGIADGSRVRALAAGHRASLLDRFSGRGVSSR